MSGGPAPVPISYSVADAAAAIGVGVTVMRELLRLGKLRRHYIGSKPVILHSDLLTFVAAQPETFEVAPAPSESERELPPQWGPRL